MAEGQSLRAEPIRSVAAASILASYVPVGSSIASTARQFLIQNLTDETVMFSFDGVNDHFVLPSNGFWLNDITTNKVASTDGFFLAYGTQLYVKRVGTPTTGNVYFSVFNGLR